MILVPRIDDNGKDTIVQYWRTFGCVVARTMNRELATTMVFTDSPIDLLDTPREAFVNGKLSTLLTIQMENEASFRHDLAEGALKLAVDMGLSLPHHATIRSLRSSGDQNGSPLD